MADTKTDVAAQLKDLSDDELRQLLASSKQSSIECVPALLSPTHRASPPLRSFLAGLPSVAWPGSCSCALAPLALLCHPSVLTSALDPTGCLMLVPSLSSLLQAKADSLKDLWMAIGAYTHLRDGTAAAGDDASKPAVEDKEGWEEFKLLYRCVARSARPVRVRRAWLDQLPRTRCRGVDCPSRRAEGE